MIEDSRISATNVGLEAPIQNAALGPVKVERLDVLMANPGTEVGLLESGANGTHSGLRGETRHA